MAVASGRRSTPPHVANVGEKEISQAIGSPFHIFEFEIWRSQGSKLAVPEHSQKKLDHLKISCSPDWLQVDSYKKYVTIQDYMKKTVVRTLKFKLRQVMQAHEVTYRAMQADTGISTSTLARLNAGTDRPSFETIEKICNYFSCEPGDLLVMEPEKDLAK